MQGRYVSVVNNLFIQLHLEARVLLPVAQSKQLKHVYTQSGKQAQVCTALLSLLPVFISMHLPVHTTISPSLPWIYAIIHPCCTVCTSVQRGRFKE